ncbi:FAD-dependent oxidoreductase [Streptomyces jumonjinensis]|uniref:FAD-dependent oxidoreductase n=1 Tax=Streptomyces jumonjinensis TaxID=1945 RepID=UPI0037B10691
MSSAPTALVIGAGVTGLTTALCLRDRGFAVTVVADRLPAETVSTVAGALWEWPPAVCGHHHDDEMSLERSRAWCMVSYRRFTALSDDPATGVRLRTAVSYFRAPVAELPREHFKMRELSHLPGFRHDRSLIGEHRLSSASGAVDAYAHLAPVIDTPAYTAWLLDRVRRSGCPIEAETVDGALTEHEHRLRSRHRADVIVNCTGLGALGLAADPALYALRGALFHLRNDGRSLPRLTTAHIMAFDASHGGQNMVFVVPHDEIVVLGGLVEAGEWSTALTYGYRPIRDMVERCGDFLPELRAAAPAADPVRVGVRPARKGGVRVEAEPGTRIVHNYGHGGSGFTLSWGCAEHTPELALRLV